MNLKEIRTAFVEASGRHDLVADVTDYENATTGLGADFFIRNGQKFLDLRFTGRNATGLVTLSLAADAYELEFEAVRAVLGVTALYDGSYLELERQEVSEFQRYWADYSEVDSGMPKHWAVVLSRQLQPERDRYVKKDHIILMPPPDEAITVTLKVKQFSTELRSNNDCSWWSLVHPDVLIAAAQYSLEHFYRNREGMSDHLAYINSFLDGIDFDQAEEDSAGPLTMEDSW